jgi:hypothetical protein
LQPQPLEQPPQPPQSASQPRFFFEKHFLKKPPRARPESQQSLQQSLGQQAAQHGTSFSTHRRTIRQQVTVSQCGTQTRTVRQA